jgi:aminoglycoside phosphotransferase (APT) family kinase protein
MRRLMDWLPGRVPDQAESTLVHVDYPMDNLVFHASDRA